MVHSHQLPASLLAAAAQAAGNSRHPNLGLPSSSTTRLAAAWQCPGMAAAAAMLATTLLQYLLPRLI